MRAILKFITQDYTNLSAGDLSDWYDLAQADNITRLNAQVRDAGTRGRRNLGWRENTTDTHPGAIDPTTGGAAAAQPKTLVCSWTEPAANKPDYCYALYGSVSTGFTPDVSNLIGIIKFPDLTFTYIGLTTGLPYYFRMRGLSTSGFMGTLEAEYTGTPT